MILQATSARFRPASGPVSATRTVTSDADCGRRAKRSAPGVRRLCQQRTQPQRNV
jgi:hypothetical protein